MIYCSTPVPLQGIIINADHCVGSVMLNIRIDNAMTAFIPKNEKKQNVKEE